MVGAAVIAVLAGGLLHLLVLTTPKPKAFFGWIMFLGTLTAALLPLTWTDVLESSISAGLVNALIGIAIWSLLLGVLSRTLRPGTTPSTEPQSISRACSALASGHAASAVVPTTVTVSPSAGSCRLRNDTPAS